MVINCGITSNTISKVGIPSAIIPTSWQHHLPLFQQVGTNMAYKCANNNNIIKNIIQQTPSKVGVLLRKTFSHTQDEARSIGMVKACVLSKNLLIMDVSVNQVPKGLQSPNSGLWLLRNVCYVDKGSSPQSVRPWQR